MVGGGGRERFVEGVEEGGGVGDEKRWGGGEKGM